MWIARDNRGNVTFHANKPRRCKYSDHIFWRDDSNIVIFTIDVKDFVTACGFKLDRVTFENSPVEITIKIKKNDKRRISNAEKRLGT